jgi:hypothetical protein
LLGCYCGWSSQAFVDLGCPIQYRRRCTTKQLLGLELNWATIVSRGKRGVQEFVYSPIDLTTIVRSRGRTSSSMNTICCQVPSISFFLSKGTDRSGPINEALMWECPFPSCHRLSCSYEPSLGAILSSMDGRSISRPGSYSIVVSAAVDPGTNRNTTPFLMVPLSTMVCTLLVMSRISPSARVCSLTVWDSTVIISSDRQARN